jgi:phage N-6-adenine-methyltransferase
MAKANVQFTKDNEYYTPKYVVDKFGVFDYDPATTPEKAAEFGVANFDTIDTNGLEQDWTQYKRIWINPPFTIKHQFLAKAQETYNKAKNEIYILFPIEFLTTKRFHDICIAGKIYIPNGRINFQSGLGKKGTSPAFGSVVLKLQDTNEVEYIVFEKDK